MPTPKWTQDIRQGNFEAAEDDLTNKAAQKIIPAIEQSYWSAQVNAAVDKIDQQAGPYTKYCKLEATQKVQQDMQQGRIQGPQQLVDSYSNHLNQGIQEFKSAVKPGHARPGAGVSDGAGNYVMFNHYEPPSPQELNDYVAGRNKVVQDQKQDGPMTGVYQQRTETPMETLEKLTARR